MKLYLQLIDTQTSGPRCDVPPLFADPAVFAQLIADLARPFSADSIDYVAGIDALGFILGAAPAREFNKGFIPLRKGGKLPVAAARVEFIDYTGQTKSLELRPGIIQPGDRVLMADEWIETGAQMQAAIDLIEQAAGLLAGIVTINIDDNSLSRRLRDKYNCQAIWFDMQESGNEPDHRPYNRR
jgi:adenine phosphoribosyltransferase